MKISTKGRYALRMLCDLALHYEDGFISLKDIAERQSISKKYLEQIVPLMNKSGLLKTNAETRAVICSQTSLMKSLSEMFSAQRKAVLLP